MNTPKSPLFVVGYARSGTTLLRSLLNAHSAIRLVNEPHLIKDMRVAGHDFDASLTLEDRQRLMKRLRRYHLESLPEGRVASVVERAGTMTFREVYEQLLPKPEEGLVWGEKSPGNLYFLSELSRLYPQGLFVLVMRDPRATLLSYYRKTRGKMPGDGLPRIDDLRYFHRQSLRWRAIMTHGLATGFELGPERFMIVRYEDLVRHPEPMLKAICERIGLGYEAGMADPVHRERDQKWVEHSAGAHALLTRAVDATRADAGSALPRWAENLLLYHTADLMRIIGYDLASVVPKPNWIVRMMAGAAAGHLIQEMDSLRVTLRDEGLAEVADTWRDLLPRHLVCVDADSH